MKKSLVFKVISTGINFVLSFTLGVLVPKIIGPESYGEYSYVISTNAFFYQLLLLSSNTAYIYFLSSKKYNTEAINSFYFIFLFFIFTTVLIIGLVSFSFDMTILYIWNDITDFKVLILGLIFGVLLNFQQRLIEYSDATLQTRSSEIVRVSSKLFLTITVLVLIFLNQLNVYIYLCISILGLIMFIYFFFKQILIRFEKISRTSFFLIFKDFYTYLRPLVIFAIIASLYSYLGKYVLQSTSGSIEQGYYNFAFQVTMIPVSFIFSIMTLFLSKMTKLYEEQDITNLKLFFLGNVNKLYALHAIVSFFLFVNADDIIFLLVGEKYISATPSVKVLSFFSLFNTLGMYSSNLFFSTGRNKLYSLINSIVMLLGLITLVCVFFLTKLNSFTLSITMLVFYVIRVNIQLVFNLKFLEIKKTSFFGELSLISLIILLITYAVSFLGVSIYLNFFLNILLILCLNYFLKDYLGIKSLRKIILKTQN